MAQSSLSNGIDFGLHTGYSDEALSIKFGPGGTFVGTRYQLWMGEHYHYAIFIAVAYLVLIYFGQWVMRTRPAYDLKPWLIGWNGVLAIFSILGAYHMLPELLECLEESGLHGSYCEVGRQFNGKAGMWSWLFVWSKLFELGDTAFLVLRKKPVIFLHSYHHAIVLALSPYQYQLGSAFGRWGVVMNLVVHSFMYTYYALRAAGFRVHKLVAMSVTIMQIIQMIIGTSVCLAVLKNLLEGDSCHVELHVAVLQLLMYFSFFLLFAKLFVQLYFSKPAKKAV